MSPPLGFGRYRCGADKGRTTPATGDLDWSHDYSSPLQPMKEHDRDSYNK